MDEVKIVELIYCDKERRGSGIAPSDPIRRVRQLYDKDGALFMEEDPEKVFTIKDLHLYTFDIAQSIEKNGCFPKGDFLNEWIKKNYNPCQQ